MSASAKDQGSNNTEKKKKKKSKPSTEIDIFATLLSKRSGNDVKKQNKKKEKKGVVVQPEPPIRASSKLTTYNAYNSEKPSKKRKKPTTLKKKILNERVIRHQAKEPTFTDVTGASISEKDNDEARTIVLLNFTSGLDYNQQVEDSDMFPLDASSNLEKGFDPDELQETIADAHDLLGKFGKIKKTFLAVIRSAEVEGKDGPIKGTIPEVCVTFVDTSSVLLALSALDGIILGGQMIQVRMLKQVEAVEDSRGREDDLPEKEDSHPPQFALSGVKVIVENLLGRGDVQELEELNEVITDIRYLCDSYGAKCSWRRTTLAVHLHTPRSLHIPNDLFSQVALKAFSRSTSTTQQSPKQLPLAMLWYSDLHAAVVACERFQGKIVEGRPLKFSFYDLRAYKVDIYSPEFCVSFPRHTSIAPSPVQASEEGNVLGVQLRGLNWVADGDSFSVHSFMHDFGIFLEMSVSSSARMRILDIVGCSSVYCARNPNRPNGQSHSVLFLGISLSECICLQSYIDGVTLNLKNVSNSQGSFQHLQTDDNSQTIKLLADVISTFAISPASDVEFFSKLSIEHNDSSFDQSSKVGEFPAIVSTPQIIATTGYGCVISVEGYVTNQDICSNIATGGITGIFPEEMKALKYDFLKLLKLHKIDIEHDSAAYCKRVHFISTNSFAMPSTPLPPQKDGVEEMDEECMNEKYDIAISFNRMMDAVDVMLTLDDIELGGEKLVSYLSEDRCSDDTIIFSFTPENSKTTVQELALPTPSVSKLPLHSTPSSNELPVASEEINTITKELLKKLATFQQRAKETDPLNAKLKERFVMGIKQVTNTIKSGRARLILLAPNSEDSEVFDEKLQNMIDVAKKNEIPVLYSLKRRQLGKAALTSMKQVTIAIVNPDGAYQEFKKIIRFLDDFQ